MQKLKIFKFNLKGTKSNLNKLDFVPFFIFHSNKFFRFKTFLMNFILILTDNHNTRHTIVCNTNLWGVAKW